MTKNQVKKNLELLYRIKQMLIQRHGFKALLDDGKRITLAYKQGGKFPITLPCTAKPPLEHNIMVSVNNHTGQISWK